MPSGRSGVPLVCPRCVRQNWEMRNERLSDAMTRAAISADQLAEAVEVDPKTVWRWASNGIVPRRVGMKQRVADVLGVDPSDLWPEPPPVATTQDLQVTDEVVAVWSHRADVPKAEWWAVLAAAELQIDLLGYAMQFLPEDHSRLEHLLTEKANRGCRVRIALADPDSPYVADRDAEEGLGGTLAARIKTTVGHFKRLFVVDGIDLRLHETRMYNSVFRGDDQMFFTPHLYGLQGYRAPLLHVRRLTDDGLFDGLAAHFERVWLVATPRDVP